MLALRCAALLLATSFPLGLQTEEVSTTLAREYLLTTERCGLICRDDTVESLSFYPNRFLGYA